MSEHMPVDTHFPEAVALTDVDSLRFEKSELNLFVDEDRDTGGNIGKMLAGIFCVLVVLMSFVAWWTNHNQYASQDPFEVPESSQSKH